MEPLLLSTLLLGGFSTYAAIRLYGGRTERDALPRALIQSSRAARLVVDDRNVTLLSNLKFQALCPARVGVNNIPDLAVLFAGAQPDARDIFLHNIQKARSGETRSVTLKQENGTAVKWFHVTFQPLHDMKGAVHIRFDDVTDNYVRDMESAEEQKRLIDYMDNTPVGFFSVNEVGRFTYVNATFARWVGETPENILAHHVLHDFLAHPPMGGEAYDLKDGGGVRQIVELTMKGKKGREFRTSVTQTVVHEGDGKVLTRAVVNDLSAEEAIRQALADSETRFKRFFDESPLGIAIINQDDLVQDCNDALSKMIGRPIDFIEGKIYTEMIDMADWPAINNVLAQIRAGEKNIPPLEMRIWKDDKKVPLPCHLFARQFSSGQNIALHFVDLTKQKDLENQFIQSQKMQAVGQLAGGIAHDFNNLLTAIIGFCDLLLLRHKPGDPSFGDIQQIKQNSNRAANLVRQLLAFSRQQTLRPQVQDITDILTEVSHLLRRLIGANIELKLVHGHGLGLVKVDGGQMEQVFVNMAVNARDAMPDGGALSITTSPFANETLLTFGEDVMPLGNWTRIDITDTGTGIPPDVMARIFEPFFTTKDVGKGTGLGLATVHGIIRQSGGYLGVDSAVGKGTTFHIYLPVAAKEEQAAQTKTTAPEESEKDLTGSARILLVEDEDAVRAFSTRALTNKGYEVLTAENGEAGLTVYNEQTKPIDVMISDVMMPGMDGPTLAKEIRAKQPDLKIIFISGYTEERLKDTLGAGIYFLQKPFTLKQLAAKVKDVLDE
jgi:two-component system cell cycle sensor histidine kinase/response regulator CckA